MGQYTGKTSREGGGGAGGPAAADEVMAKKFPALLEYLTETRWPDGKPRVTSTVLILCEDGYFKACVNDRANSRTAWCSAKSYAELLVALEKGLQESSLEFRAPRPQRGR